MARARQRLNLQAISQLAELADYTVAFAVRAIGALGVADHLAEGPRHVDYLAQQTQCDPHALLRVMRALATKSIVTETERETFRLEPMGELLRSDHPLSMRWCFRLEPDVQAMAGLEGTVRTGEPAFRTIFGDEYFAYLAAHPDKRQRFRESQRALNRLEFLAIVRAYPWGGIASVVDIGGNDGSLLAGLLRRNPQMRGTLFDLPATAAEARKIFAEAGVADRAAIEHGVVFDDAVPAGADLYAMKRILVGFSDDETVRALTNVAGAMAPTSRLLIMEPLVGGASKVGSSLDLRVLVLGLGRLRTSEEFARLLGAAGLSVQRVDDVGLVSILEAKRPNG